MTSSFEIDTSVAHAARVHNYLAGGRDHFAADREAIDYAAEVLPGGLHAIRSMVLSMRSFMWRAATYLVQEAGVCQFVKLGTAIPTGQAFHKVAQQADPRARVVYVCDDPVVLAHAHALLRGHPAGTTAYTHLSPIDVDEIIWRAAETLDFSRPIAVMVQGTLSLVPEERDPYGIMARLFKALPPGSFLALAHITDEIDEVRAASARLGERLGTVFTARSRAQIGRFFDGLELVSPGLVPIEQWPRGRLAAQPDVLVPICAGVGRKLLSPAAPRIAPGPGEDTDQSDHAGTGPQAAADNHTHPDHEPGPDNAGDHTDPGDDTSFGDHTDPDDEIAAYDQPDAGDQAGAADRAGAWHAKDTARERGPSEVRKALRDGLSGWASVATIVATVVTIVSLLGFKGRETQDDQRQTAPTMTAAPGGAAIVPPTEILVTPDMGTSRATIEVTISGRGFAPNERVRMEVSAVEGVCPPTACSSLKDVHAGADGSFDAVRVLVPLHYPAGQTVFLTARGMMSHRTGSQPFAVTAYP